jgi:CarD family transcriptional regulator
MFEIGEYVNYGTNGIFQIVDIRKECFDSKTEKEYYILQPVYSSNSTIYVPADNETVTKKMQYILTPEEVHDLIKSIPEEETFWIQDDRLRREKFTKILRNGDRRELIGLLKTLYKRKKERNESGHKFFAVDENILNTAERILHQEFALVLNIKPEEVVPFIRKELESITQNQ